MSKGQAQGSQGALKSVSLGHPCLRIYQAAAPGLFYHESEGVATLPKGSNFLLRSSVREIPRPLKAT